LVIVDPMLWGAMVAAEASGTPWISIAHDPLFIRGTGLDLRGPGMKPTRGIRGLIGRHLLAAAQKAAGRENLQVVNVARERRGLERIGRLDDLYLKPTLTIAATAEPFEYPRP